MISERHTSLVLGGSWGRNEQPAHIDVWHEASAETLRYVPDRTCRDKTSAPQSFLCSECGWFDTDFDDLPLDYNYCPHCGARVVSK